MCAIARELMRGEHNIGRIIARPFVGQRKGEFTRTANRKDFSVTPTGQTAVERIHRAGQKVVGIGKIADIFDRVGIDLEIRSESNSDGMKKTIDLVRESDANTPTSVPTTSCGPRCVTQLPGTSGRLPEISTNVSPASVDLKTCPSPTFVFASFSEPGGIHLRLYPANAT